MKLIREFNVYIFNSSSARFSLWLLQFEFNECVMYEKGQKYSDTNCKQNAKTN